MSDSVAPSGIDLPSPTLSARLGEVAAYLAAPTAGRLTEEQRALALGIARRLIREVASELDAAIDTEALWQDWLARGIPAANILATSCFARAEEHRWRGQSAVEDALRKVAEHSAAVAEASAGSAPMTPADRAYLMLQIADGHRHDALGNPCIAPVDLDAELFRALLFDIAAWQLGRLEGDGAHGARLGEAVNGLLASQGSAPGIDAAAADYYAALADEQAVPAAAGNAIARHDWLGLIAIAATARNSGFEAMAIDLLSAEAAALPSLLAPLRIDRAALAPLEVSLAQLADRAIAEDLADEGSGSPGPER